MTYATPSTRTAILRLAALCDKAMGYPSTDHVHVGGGRHYVPPDGIYTRTWAEPRKHPDRDEYTLALGPRVREAVTSARLSESERTELDTAERSASELDSTWETRL